MDDSWLHLKRRKWMFLETSWSGNLQALMGSRLQVKKSGESAYQDLQAQSFRLKTSWQNLFDSREGCIEH